MMTTVRTTRRPRRCTRDCGVPIRTGERVEHTAIPPRSHDIITCETWVHLATHAGPCPDPETMPPEELAAARAEHDAWFGAQLDELHGQLDALSEQIDAVNANGRPHLLTGSAHE